MAGRKQSRPKRANNEIARRAAEEQGTRPRKRNRKSTDLEAGKIYWSTKFMPDLAIEPGKEVAEINLLDIKSTVALESQKLKGEEIDFENTVLRVRVRMDSGRKTQVGGFPELSRNDLRVEVIRHPVVGMDDFLSEDGLAHDDSEGSEDVKVVFSGEVDGPDAAISALAYLIRLEYVILRLCSGCSCASSGSPEFEVPRSLRVVIRNKAFLNPGWAHRRTLWKKAMQTIMTWLRPELISVMRFGVLKEEEIKENLARKSGDDVSERLYNNKEQVFDPMALYDAIKPSCTEHCPDMSFPQLLPILRPYQCRAAFWMVQRERGLGRRFDFGKSKHEFSAQTSNHQHFTSSSADLSTRIADDHPLWVEMLTLDGTSNFYYNRIRYSLFLLNFCYNRTSGAVSLEPHDFVSYIHGGILADEMGLGKTVEVLACILANPYKDLQSPSAAERTRQKLEATLASRKHQRVECVCGAVGEDSDYQDAWVQCDICDASQHATCVGRGPAELWAGLKDISKSEQIKKSKCPGGKRSKRVQSSTMVNSRKQVITRKLATPKQKSREESKNLSRKDGFVCGSCAEMIGSVEVEGIGGATLVVCPTPILRQWQEEILRHTKPGSLQIIVYEGVEKGATVLMGLNEAAVAGSRERLKIVSAHDLAAADIVLTTYDTLRSDLYHDSDKTKSNQRSLRYGKRYPVIPTPLTRLRWWRVCLDEAQMVESSTARATEMALLLDAQNRWCVSGTPIQRGLDDIFGLLKFLQAEPFDNYVNWSQALQQPYEAGDDQVVHYMHKFLGSLMWRSSKLQVKDELNLPPQEESVSWLRFSAVEAHFYRLQHEKCAVKAREVINKYRKQLQQKSRRSDTRASPSPQCVNSVVHEAVDTERRAVVDLESDGLAAVDLVSGIKPTSQMRCTQDSCRECEGQMDAPDSAKRVVLHCRSSVAYADQTLSHSEASLLSSSLLKLRQACCHPQVGSSGIRALQQQSPMTMDEILQVLVDKAKIEAEESLRVLIGALNGLAALAAIENDIPLAVSIYREVLALTEENAADVNVDPLQKLHTLHNLADIMGMSQLEVESTGNDALESIEHGTINTIIGLTGSDVRSQPKQAQSSSLNIQSIPRTLRDDILVKQCEEIKSKYLGSFHAKHTLREREFESAYLQVLECKKDCEAFGGTTWWLEVLAMAEQHSDGGKGLVLKIRNHLLDSGKGRRRGNASSLALRFREISGLKYVLQSELDALANTRESVLVSLKKLNKIMDSPTAEDAECHANCLRHSDSNGRLCAHCELDDLFQVYENRLLLLRTSSTQANGWVSAEDASIAQHRILAHKRITGSRDPAVKTDRNQFGGMHDMLGRNRRLESGTGAVDAEVLRAPSETEQILSIIKAHARLVGGAEKRDAANKHLQTFEAMKKEYFQMRAWTKVQRDMLNAIDELNMATTRLRLQFPGEEVENEIEKLVKLHPEEVPVRSVQLTSEKFDAVKDFSCAKGQLRYLKGLSLARWQAKERINPATSVGERITEMKGWGKVDDESCPVCQEKLGSQLMVLPCGHLLCCKCCMLIIERAPMAQGVVNQKRINCPSCRQWTYVGNVAFVDNGRGRNAIAAQMGEFPGGSKEDEEASLQVKGSYGTKIEAVVRRILWVKLKDPYSKVLVFSTWIDVLDVVEHAMSANKITFARVKGRNLDLALQKFRGNRLPSTHTPGSQGESSASDEHIQVLLLPIQQGGNGLNLVEAQHVFLVEPFQNPAVEAQAINRVHRIGQKRATFVHRFVVIETVEETIYWLGRTKAQLAERLPGSGMGSRKRDRYSLTLNDVSALFAHEPCQGIDDDEGNSQAASGGLRSLPAATAAAIAAEARFSSAPGVPQNV